MAYVLNDNMQKCTCHNCFNDIVYFDEDVYMGDYGLEIECPVCHDLILVKKIAQNKYPEAFCDFSGGFHLSDERVQEYVDQCVDSLIKNDMDYTFTGTGDTMVFATWEDEDAVNVVVTQNYKEATINKEWWLENKGRRI